MKQFIAPSYTFTPAAAGVGTVNLSGIANFNIKNLVSIINQTRGIIIYSTASASLGFTDVTGTTVTLQVSTIGQDPADVLQVIYEFMGSQLSEVSSPVVIASDQTVAVSQADTFITGQAAQAALINNILNETAGPDSLDVSGFKSGSIQVVSTATAGLMIFEASNNNINFVPFIVQSTSGTTGQTNSFVSANSSSSGIFAFPIVSRFLRLRISTAATGGSIQAFTRLSRDPYSTITQVIAQQTATQLITTAVASLAATASTDISNAAITTTTIGAVSARLNIQALAFQVTVGAVSGTNPTLDIKIQESLDGLNWMDVYQFDRFTGIGFVITPPIRLTSSLIRYVRTVGGTTPSFTMNAIGNPRSGDGVYVRRIVDRTILPNALNSVTDSIMIEGSTTAQMVVSMSAGGSVSPIIQMQGSEDNISFYNLGAAVTAAPSTNSIISVASVLPRFLRAIVSTAGTGAVLNYISLKGIN